MIKALFIIILFSLNDTTISVYRRGIDKIKIAKEPIKRYKNTPKRKILYTIPVNKIVMINDKKGIIIK